MKPFCSGLTSSLSFDCHLICTATNGASASKDQNLATLISLGSPSASLKQLTAGVVSTRWQRLSLTAEAQTGNAHPRIHGAQIFSGSTNRGILNLQEHRYLVELGVEYRQRMPLFLPPVPIARISRLPSPPRNARPHSLKIIADGVPSLLVIAFLSIPSVAFQKGPFLMDSDLSVPWSLENFPRRSYSQLSRTLF